MTPVEERQQETEIVSLVLEEVISQRNTLMNELASLRVQLKVVQKKCELLEQKYSQEAQGAQLQENSDGN